MSGSSRQIFFATVVVLLLVALGVWWYLGFSLDFMRFFAADPGVTDTTGQTCTAPAGCTCQVVQCVQAPCDPIIVCPTKSATPRPSAPPGCYYQEVQCIQAPCDPVLVCPSCMPRPACLDTVPTCDIAEPAEGWCPPGGGRMVSCSPNTQTVKVGVQAALTGSGGDGRYAWLSPEGNTASGFTSTGSTDGIRVYNVTYGTPGTKKVTVESTRGDGSRNVDSVACTVIVTSNVTNN